jgi:hypothetical protein
MLTGGRHSTRHRTSTAFYTYDRLGGEIDKKAPIPTPPPSNLIGSQFWDTEEENSDELPENFTIIGAGRHQGQDCLEYKLTRD